ncbi:MAG TPA: response regulator [Bacteroidales bacterium]|nr:response regulator [Bacteroidales bacterium]
MVLGNKKKEITELKARLAEKDNEINRLREVIDKISIDENSFFNLKFTLKLLDTGGIGIITYDGEKVWLSQAAKEILGYKGEAHMSLDQIRNSVLPEDRQAFEKTLNDISQGFKIPETEMKIARAEGEGREFRMISLSFLPVGTRNDSFIATIKDITKQDKIKKELIRSRDKAEESEKLKNTLLTNISHDIRTPMNSIIGFSELLNIGNLPYDKRVEYVRTIKNQGILLLKMIDDVVELTRMETGKITIRKSPCNLELLMKELLSSFNQYKAAQNKEHLDIRITYPEIKGITIYTDPGRLQQLIWSLISNSVKFTEKGGIEIGYKPISEQRIEFYVKDTGIGLSRDLQKKLFSRSSEEEVNGKSEGSGLGLNIAKNLIRLMGGKIWVESELGQGSTFFFTIPFEAVPESYHVLAPEEEYVIPSYMWKDKVILVAEDDEINFKFLEAVLHDTSAQVLLARNGMEAVELCRTINKIDLILMDIKMPEMDGFEATKMIRQFNRKVPIIAQTAFVMQDDLVKCQKLGCNDYITKPIDIKEFFEKVDGFLKES